MLEISLEDCKSFCLECKKKLGHLNRAEQKIFHKGKEIPTRRVYEASSITPNKRGLTRKRCFDCMFKKFGRSDWKPNNPYSEMSDFLFDVDSSGKRAERNSILGVSEKKLIEKYGEVEGLKRWNEYKRLQSISNTFEYKRDKYGWSREQFDNFNKSRSSTKANFVKRHGLEQGTKLWEEYRSRQSYAGNKLEYFIEKFGEENGRKKYEDVNSKKALTLENFIRLYGLEAGETAYEEYRSGQHKFFSNISQELFWDIEKSRPSRSYFAEKNTEFGRQDSENSRYYFFDFVDPERSKIIEFNGTIWHMDPREFSPDDKQIKSGRTASDVWKADEDKINFAKRIGFDVLVVWEMDYNSNKDKVLSQCLEFLER